MATVTLHEEKDFWTLSIRGGNFAFHIDEPGLFTYEEWCQFLDKTTNTLDFYQGNGEGYIKSDGEAMVMVAGPSGAGGDVTLDVTVPFAEYAPAIREKIDLAERRGLFKTAST